MKRRIAKSLDERKPLPRRNIGKYIYMSLMLQHEWWSVSIGSKCYVMLQDGRVIVYSQVLSDGRRLKCKGYYMWNCETQPPYPEYFED